MKKRDWMLMAGCAVCALVAGCSTSGSGVFDSAAMTQDTTNDPGPISNETPSETDVATSAPLDEISELLSDPDIAYMLLDADTITGEPSVVDSGESLVRSLAPAWFRAFRPVQPEIAVTVEDNIAHVVVTAALTGVLKVDANADLVFGQKPIRAIATRYATFERVETQDPAAELTDERERPGRRWRPVSLSLNDIDLADPESQTVDITQVRALSADGSELATYTDPALEIALPDLTTVTQGETVTIEVTATAPAGAEIYLQSPGPRAPGVPYDGDRNPPQRPEADQRDGRDGDRPAPEGPPDPAERPGLDGDLPRPERPPFMRHYLNDEGIGADDTAGDGIYTGELVVQQGPGLHKCGIDVIARPTLADEETEDYDSTTWVIPYRVLPAITDRPVDDAA